MKKKLLILFFAIVSTVCLAFGFAGCELLDEIASLSGESGASSESESGETEQSDEGDGETEDGDGGSSDSSSSDSGSSDSGSSDSGSSGGSSSDSGSSSGGSSSDSETGGEIEEGASDGLTYKKSGSGYAVSGIGTCTDTEIVISSTYNGISVVSIGDEAFKNYSSLISITIPDSVASIGDSAFYDCTALTSVIV